MIDLNSEPRDIEAGAEKANPIDQPEPGAAADFERDREEFDEDSWKDEGR